MSTLVHVHAWEYVNGDEAGGGGFDWYAVEANARHAYETALKETAESNWANFFVSGVTVQDGTPDAITAEIDDRLTELCARASVRKVGSDVLAYWNANDFDMGTADAPAGA